MKYIILTMLLFSFNAVADQRFETTGGFCHFVTPEGFANNNDDNEVFFANCENSIRQKANGDGEGSTTVKVDYPAGAVPFYGEHKYSGADTGINCVMVDSNNTQYTTQDWDSNYKVRVKDLKDFQKAFFTQEGDKNYDRDFDYNEDGFIDYSDLTIFRTAATSTIEYTIVCRNAAQQ
jgi:hypothetical protein